MRPDFAFYYPGQYVFNVDWVKNLILFFDGIAMLIPIHMADHRNFDDLPLIRALKDHDMFRVIRPETAVGPDETRELANAFAGIVSSGRLDHLTRGDARQSSFGSLSMSRLGFYGDADLADSIVRELKSRGLAGDSEDGVTIPIHVTVRTLLLVLLAQILRGQGPDAGVTLSPATDRVDLLDALNELTGEPDGASQLSGGVVSFDMAMVGVDLSRVPIDEVLDFRRQHYSLHRDYRLLVRQFARELAAMPPDERVAAFETRQEELDDAAQMLKKKNRAAWKKAASFGLTCTGAALTLHGEESLGTALTVGGAALNLLGDPSGGDGAYSYLMSVQRRFANG